MSGGHYQYAYHHVGNFADSLDSYIIGENYSYLSNDTILALGKVSSLCKATAAIMKETEWLASSDIREDEFMKRLPFLLDKLEGEL